MTTLRLKYLADINPRNLAEQTDPNLRFRYVDIGAVGRGRLVAEPQSMTFAEAPTRARRLVGVGDTVISTVRTYLRAVWPVQGPCEDLVVSTGFSVISPGPNLERRFFGWLAQSDPFIEEIVGRSVGVSYPAIRPEEIRDLRIQIPPLPQQRAIADFLDVETARIDALIGKKRRMVRLLSSRQQAFADGRLDSIADVPLVALRHLARGPGSLFTDGDWIETPFITDAGLRLVQTGNIGRGTYREQGGRYISAESFDLLRCTEVLPGDVLICRLAAPVGRACLAPDLGVRMVTAVDVCILRPVQDVEPRYVAAYCSSSRYLAEIDAIARGGTRERISREQLGAIRVPLPDSATQRRVVNEIDESRLWSVQLIHKIERQIQLLREHRQALITAAVTGELAIP